MCFLFLANFPQCFCFFCAVFFHIFSCTLCQSWFSHCFDIAFPHSFFFLYCSCSLFVFWLVSFSFSISFIDVVSLIYFLHSFLLCFPCLLWCYFCLILCHCYKHFLFQYHWFCYYQFVDFDLSLLFPVISILFICGDGTCSLFPPSIFCISSTFSLSIANSKFSTLSFCFCISYICSFLFAFNDWRLCYLNFC